jgi:hypothetical protein
VRVEVTLDLALGLDEEPETRRVTGTSREEADAEGARIPQRIEEAGTRAELVETLGRPRQV